MAWTDERIAQLKKLWEEGKSASQIAEILGDGMSRNAVIGKAHRLGLSSRPSPLKQAAAAAAPTPAAGAPAAPTPIPAPAAIPAAPLTPPKAAVPASEAALKPRPVAAAPAPAAKPGKDGKVSLLELNDRICKWPIGHPDEADFHFCGKPVNPGFPYCGEHCLVAYQAQLPRKDRPHGQQGRPIMPNLPRPR